MLSKIVLSSDPKHDLVALKYDPGLNSYNIRKTNTEITDMISTKMCAKTLELSLIEGGGACGVLRYASGLEVGILFLAAGRQIKQEIGMEITIHCILG